MADLPAFKDPSLLKRALTHRSFANEHPEEALEDNERLEFLGDAVLDFIVAAFLYHRFPEMREGRLTSLRAALVRTEALAGLATQVGIDRELRLGRGEEESGGRTRPPNLCAAFEAVVGALYLDQGLEAVQAWVEPMLRPAVERVLRAELDKDARSLLQEWSQAHLGLTPVYRTVAAEGPDHAKAFTVQVSIGDQVVGEGSGRSKQAAARAAAEAALLRLAEAQAITPGEDNQGAGSEATKGDDGPAGMIAASSLPPLPPGAG
jgi:ribonuclease-3